MGRVNNIRNTIRMLQEIPFVVSLAVLATYILDFADTDIMYAIYPVFGFITVP